jgi:succinate dehydrogenase/fumarate reductase-like Fe-S protein
MHRLYAVALLAWGLLRSVVAALFGRRRGIAAFRASYAGDRLPPLTPAERSELPRFGGCIACGLCDVGEGARAVASAGAYAGVMDLVLASSRSMPDYDAAARSFAAVSDERLAALERRCPTRVPMRAIAAFVRAKARVDEKSARVTE